MNPNPIQNLFLRGGAHDLRLRSNYQKPIESYNKVAGIANLALGKSYKVVDGSNVYYVNKQDLINALGIVDPNVTDAMIEREMRWQKILPTIQQDRVQLDHFIVIPGAKEYLMDRAEGKTPATLNQFAENFDSQLLNASPAEREELFKFLFSEMAPNLVTLRPFLEQVRNLDDKDKRYDLVLFFANHAPEALAKCKMDFRLDSDHKETIALQLLKHHLDQHLDEYKENPLLICLLLDSVLRDSVFNPKFINLIKEKDMELAYKALDFYREDQKTNILLELAKEKIEIEGNEDILLRLLKKSPSFIMNIGMMDPDQRTALVKFCVKPDEMLLFDSKYFNLNYDQKIDVASHWLVHNGNPHLVSLSLELSSEDFVEVLKKFEKINFNKAFQLGLLYARENRSYTEHLVNNHFEKIVAKLVRSPDLLFNLKFKKSSLVKIIIHLIDNDFRAASELTFYCSRFLDRERSIHLLQHAAQKLVEIAKIFPAELDDAIRFFNQLTMNITAEIEHDELSLMTRRQLLQAPLILVRNLILHRDQIDHESYIALIKELAGDAPEAVCSAIQDFGLEDEEERYALATQLAKENFGPAIYSYLTAFALNPEHENTIKKMWAPEDRLE